MTTWWVNQNQTFAYERDGGYLWSPKTKRNEARNQFYDNMTLVEPGDLIVSFKGSRIVAMSVAVSRAYEGPKPSEFGSAGENWHHTGWRVDADYVDLPEVAQIRPKDHIEVLRRHLPAKYSPLKPDGSGNQGVYLAELPDAFAGVLLHLIPDGPALAAALGAGDPDRLREQVADRIEREIAASCLDDTMRTAVIAARRGQGSFRDAVLAAEPGCRVTGVTNRALLIASHIKPWADCATHTERLDRANGLALTPTVDKLFDAGLITFDDDGTLRVSPRLDPADATAVGLDHPIPARPFTTAQRTFLAHHRREVFKARTATPVRSRSR